MLVMYYCCLYFIPQKTERRDNGVETDDEPMDSDDVSEKKRLPTFSDYFIIYPTQAGKTVRVDDREICILPEGFGGS